MSNNNFLKNLKEGDRVLVGTVIGGKLSRKIATVNNITETGFIEVNGIQFDPDTGCARAKHYRLSEATPGDCADCAMCQ